MKISNLPLITASYMTKIAFDGLTKKDNLLRN